MSLLLPFIVVAKEWTRRSKRWRFCCCVAALAIHSCPAILLGYSTFEVVLYVGGNNIYYIMYYYLPPSRKSSRFASFPSTAENSLNVNNNTNNNSNHERKLRFSCTFLLWTNCNATTGKPKVSSQRNSVFHNKWKLCCGCHCFALRPLCSTGWSTYNSCHYAIIIICGCISAFLCCTLHCNHHHHHHPQPWPTWSYLKRVQVYILNCALRSKLLYFEGVFRAFAIIFRGWEDPFCAYTKRWMQMIVLLL